MGSNDNRHGTRKQAREWGSKARKEEQAQRSRAADEFAIRDSIESNEFVEPESVCCGGDSKACQIAGPCWMQAEDSRDWEAEQHRHRPPAKRRKKDTRRWCKGKEGVEHVMEVYDPTPWRVRKLFKWNYKRCANCGMKDWRVKR